MLASPRGGVFSTPLHRVDSAPQNILYVRPDTFGDLVIFAPALDQLMAAWPKATHTLLVRPGYDNVAPLFPSALRWHVAAINPFKDAPDAARAEVDQLFAALAANPPDLIVAATLNRTWLEVALAARFPQARRVALGHGAIDPLFATAAQIAFGVDTRDVFSETVPVDENAQEWDNNFRLVDHLLGRAAERRVPELRVPAAAQTAAAAVLAQHGLQPQRWAAVFPAGLANVAIKAWPADHFADVVRHLQEREKTPVLLLGHTSERAALEAVAAACEKRGAAKPALWLGRDGEMPLLAALLQSARIYFGHDTGPMHLAAAVGTPVAAVFGGGHWPRFRPAGRQVISLVQPLPCFGCNWDCHFGDAPCVKLVPAADAIAAVRKLFDAGTQPLDLIHESQAVSPDALRLITAVTPRYRALQGDRLDRQHKIEELTHLGREKDVEITDLKRAAEERKVEMESIKAELEAECAQKDTEIADLKRESDTKDTEIGSLKHEADVKDGEIASLKAEANTKDDEIASLKAEANTKDSEIEQLKATCNEREALIFKLTDIVKDFQRQVADHVAAHQQKDATLAAREASLAALTAERDQLAAELAKVQSHFAALPPDAAHYGQALHDKDVHIRNLELMLREARASVDNYAAGYGELEQTKRFGRWLHEKEVVLQQLKRACDEREALIQQIAAHNAGLGRVQKTWVATQSFWTQKVSRPSEQWLFDQLVERKEVQLGILRQYQPRPLVWDKGLKRKPSVPEVSLPEFDIVTPSYNQDKFLESTMLSVLNQQYPKLRYHVQDGGSKDRSVELLQRYADRLTSWESVKDRGQSDAIRRGFARLPGRPDDIMAWLNSDDLIAPRALRYVGEYFARHPDVDVVYGHRIVIDDFDQEIGRWFLPKHDPEVLDWIDYVPQETMFFRRRIWDAIGGLDPSFQFALDWDLIARMQQAKAKIVRLPYFLGAFRVHVEQKTSAVIHTTGHEEMTRIRTRIHGPHLDPARIEHFARKTRLASGVTAKLFSLGLRV
jgi:ADP-heptose:LPS heptosyltransferase/GT2 family glycosyltransferase/predicted  nucleic acid-binding Zn-ribbon protein